MGQHPIPRQITTFEFKLIGFMTLKQFLYLVIFIPLGFITYFIFPIPLINILLGVMVAVLGVAFAFLPVNDRPLDVWIKNLLKRLNSPTQFTFQKNNPPLSLFQNLYFVADPHRVMAHIESQEKLSAYLTKTKQTMIANQKKRALQHLIQKPSSGLRINPPSIQTSQQSSSTYLVTPPQNMTVQNQSSGERKPYVLGLVRNNRKIPLPGILIYVKDQNNNPVRLLKTNPHGVFATYSSLSKGKYLFEIKDPKNIYFFDTMKVNIEEQNSKPLEFFSRELL